MGDVILTMKDIDKSFPGVHALDHVNFEVRRGEVHALYGRERSRKVYTDEGAYRYFTRRIPEQLHIKAKRQNFTIPVKLRMLEW